MYFSAAQSIRYLSLNVDYFQVNIGKRNRSLSRMRRIKLFPIFEPVPVLWTKAVASIACGILPQRRIWIFCETISSLDEENMKIIGGRRNEK